jgi:hypothetical protein
MRKVRKGKMDNSKRLRQVKNFSCPWYSNDKASQEMGAETMARYWVLAQKILPDSETALNSKTYANDQKATVSMKAVNEVAPKDGLLPQVYRARIRHITADTNAGIM